MRFEDVYGRYRIGRLSCEEAAELLGTSVSSFYRWRERYEEQGSAGLADGRIGKASGRRAPVDEVGRVLALFETRYFDFTVRHFHEKLVVEHGVKRSYSWTKNKLQTAGLVRRAKRRGQHRRKRERRVLTDRGTEFCASESHEYELYLAVEDIDHTRTTTKSPQTNGICERFHRTVFDEFYRVAFRKKICRTIGELQADLDLWPQDPLSHPPRGEGPGTLDLGYGRRIAGTTTRASRILTDGSRPASRAGGRQCSVASARASWLSASWWVSFVIWAKLRASSRHIRSRAVTCRAPASSSPSKKKLTGTLMTRAISKRRPAETRLMPRSYLWAC
jgi:transposase